MVQVGITSGLLRWSITVVRPCDMMWMGVTADFDLDVSQWAARSPDVWMASEDCSCLAHLHGAISNVFPSSVMRSCPFARLACAGIVHDLKVPI